MHSGHVGCKNTSRRFISFWDEPKSFSKSFKCQFLLVLFFVNVLMPWTRLAAVGPQRGRLVRARLRLFSRVMSAALARWPLEIFGSPPSSFRLRWIPW